MATIEEREQQIRELSSSFTKRAKSSVMLSIALSAFLAAAAGVWLIFVISQISQLDAQKQALKGDIADLNRDIVNLRQEKDGLSSWKEDLAKANETLAQTARTNVQTPAAESELQTAENARYAVGVYGFDVSSKLYDDVLSRIKSDGYSISQAGLLSERPEWLSLKPTVLYYDKSSEEKAQSIKSELRSLTGIDFRVERGSGQGVVKGQERWTFFIHLVGG